MPIHLVLPITLTIAGAAALLHIWIANRVGEMRRFHKVSIGDGGVEPLIARMRAHANFIENAPFFLILLALVELARGSSLWLWGAGILFILGAATLFSGSDGLAKYLMQQGLPVMEVAWVRYIVFVAIACVPALRSGPAVLGTRHPWMQLLRGGAVVASALLFIYGVRPLPLADVPFFRNSDIVGRSPCSA